MVIITLGRIIDFTKASAKIKKNQSMEETLKDLMNFSDERLRRTILKNIPSIIHDSLWSYWRDPGYRDDAINFVTENGMNSFPLRNVYEHLQSLTPDANEPYGVHINSVRHLAHFMMAYVAEKKNLRLEKIYI